MRPKITSGHITTNDGVRLQFHEAGDGPDLVLVSGWTLTADLWHPYLERLGRTHHVVAFDHRGHGNSDSPAYGYRIARLAADTREIIEQLALFDVTLVGFSMGCAVVFGYWDLYRRQDLSHLVLIDQPAVVASRPEWPAGLAERLGTFIPAENVPAFTAKIRGPEARDVVSYLVNGMTTPVWSEEARSWIRDRMLCMDRDRAATLMFDNALQDFRDLAATIDIPTLVIGGAASIFPATAMEELAESIPGSTLHIVAADNGGSHLSIVENPAEVIETIRSFLDKARR